jgi:hypothetical protein
MVNKLSQYRFSHIFYFWFFLQALTFLFFYIPDAPAATQASFEWSPNTEPDLAGYRIFCREQSQSYDYAHPSWEGTDTYSTIYNLDESKSHCFVVRAFDTEGFESENSTEACLEPLATPDQSPTADAGPDQIVDEGQAVVLNGSNSTDPDDGIASYHWIQMGEPSIVLSDPDAAQLTFTAPDVGFEGAALTFELTVTDYNGNQGKDVCVVNVTWQNEPPRAIAGADQTVDEGVVVTLDGSLSLDIDDGISSYLWTQVGVPTVTLSNPASSMPTFIAPDVGPEGLSLAFQLTVTDTGNLQHTDACIVNITWQNEPPTAVVAPDYVETTEGALVILDGSASTDSDDGVASYLWTQTEGDPVSFSNPTSAVASFTAPKTETFDKNIELRLTVTDRGGLKGTKDSSVYVMQSATPNNPPAADFSYATKKKKVTCTDRSTDSDGTIVSWSWDFGDGNYSTEQSPMHRYVQFGKYLVTLTVTDREGASHSISKTVSITK